ncbi:hypothetical protein AMEX_G6132 [Astyanax mexicanus]|uniref:Uncharacterized protein n=1 Tax=Astyanax mexicanus TaxID=7994 RepID=A0A8T2M104_ASTMX|nr:hypothetical protein AMEX_G6132 [Astyanax mexicanus]
MSNKDSLKEYACSFPRVIAAADLQKLQNEVQEKAAEPGQEDLRLLGFGQHRELTWRELYDAEDKEKKGYVKWIKRQTPRPGTQMEAFREYVL